MSDGSGWLAMTSGILVRDFLVHAFGPILCLENPVPITSCETRKADVTSG